MRIALFGAGGMIGRRILEEALRRGHEVTAVVRDPTRFSGAADRVAVVQGDVVDAASVAAAVRGHDAVISAVGPAHTPDARPQMLRDAARALMAGAPGPRLPAAHGRILSPRPQARAGRCCAVATLERLVALVLTPAPAPPAAPAASGPYALRPRAAIRPRAPVGTRRAGQGPARAPAPAPPTRSPRIPPRWRRSTPPGSRAAAR